MLGLFRRHVIVGSAGAVLIYIFWLSRPDWVGEMRFWKAVGDASLILLYLTLILGPAARFVQAPAVSSRRASAAHSVSPVITLPSAVSTYVTPIWVRVC